MAKSTLIDTTKCVGCRSCQVTCKQWNVLKAEKPKFSAQEESFQNPKTLAANTFVVVQEHVVDDAKAPAGFKTVFAKRQCMHCEDPACVSACPTTAMHKTPEGPVVYNKSKCIGCRYCLMACPWSVPTAEWDSRNPTISKCTMCYSRLHQELPSRQNGAAAAQDSRKGYAGKMAVPACVKQCPAGALTYGERKDMLAEAKRRIAENPGKYVDHIYGENEVGGTGMLYLSSVPFSRLGFPEVSSEPVPHLSSIALGSVSPAAVGIGSLLGATYALNKRREAVAKAESAEQAERKKMWHEEPHPTFAPVPSPIFTSVNKMLLAIMGFGALSFVLRFLLGLGASTHLNDTWAWGLWIMFDLVWIALAAGAFATAGLIYVFRRHDLYSIGRTAVLLGFLSYTVVVLTLVADIGLPWHFYSLALNHPKHSAMFEVSWCIGLYVTVLALEFVPVVFERFGEQFGLQKYAEMWRKYHGLYVAVAMTGFVFMLSHSVLWAGLAALAFGTMAWFFRAKPGQKAEPIMLAIAAVTFSTMHQSSLGSIFLLMADKVSHLWWSPIMPINFFLSSVVAGTGMMCLVELWISRAFKRRLDISKIASLAQVTFWSALVYQLVRLGDLAYRGRLHEALVGAEGKVFLFETIVCGLLPIILLMTNRLRQNSRVVFLAAELSVFGVVVNRLGTVVIGMHLKGTMPQYGPLSYNPSLIEWGVTAGVVATTIFLFGLAVRYLPVLPSQSSASCAD